MIDIEPVELTVIEGGGLEEELARLIDDMLNPIKPCFPQPTRPEL